MYVCIVCMYCTVHSVQERQLCGKKIQIDARREGRYDGKPDLSERGGWVANINMQDAVLYYTVHTHMFQTELQYSTVHRYTCGSPSTARHGTGKLLTISSVVYSAAARLAKGQQSAESGALTALTGRHPPLFHGWNPFRNLISCTRPSQPLLSLSSTGFPGSFCSSLHRKVPIRYGTVPDGPAPHHARPRPSEIKNSAGPSSSPEAAVCASFGSS